MKHGTDSAPEVGIDELAARRASLPGKVRVVHVVVHVEQEVSQCFRGGKVVDVNETMGWRGSSVIMWMSTHYDGQDVVHQAIHEELLRHVVPTIGVFEGQVVLVRRVEQGKALLLTTARTALCPTSDSRFNDAVIVVIVGMRRPEKRASAIE